MPCTQHEDQQKRRIPVMTIRSTFNDTFPRFPNAHENLQASVIQANFNHNHHHQVIDLGEQNHQANNVHYERINQDSASNNFVPVAILNANSNQSSRNIINSQHNQEHLTPSQSSNSGPSSSIPTESNQQISINVLEEEEQDHQGSYIYEVGGNISAVLDSFVDDDDEGDAENDEVDNFDHDHNNGGNDHLNDDDENDCEANIDHRHDIERSDLPHYDNLQSHREFNGPTSNMQTFRNRNPNTSTHNQNRTITNYILSSASTNMTPIQVQPPTTLLTSLESMNNQHATNSIITPSTKSDQEQKSPFTCTTISSTSCSSSLISPFVNSLPERNSKSSLKREDKTDSTNFNSKQSNDFINYHSKSKRVSFIEDQSFGQDIGGTNDIKVDLKYQPGNKTDEAQVELGNYKFTFPTIDSTQSSQIRHSYEPPLYHQTGFIKDYLFNGSSFTGTQKSKNESYDVNVNILYINHEEGYLCGYLCINHLTKSHPSLTTFFEGEIISERHPFLTRKWETNRDIDHDHWSKFEHFKENYCNNFNSDNFDYENLKNSDYIYMRWKERFLVPDHTVEHVEGASYAGFYYICYSKMDYSIKGYYFHINSEHFESFQFLKLNLDATNTSQVFEFR